MQIGDISPWGAVVLLLLTGLSVSLFLFIDRRMVQRLWRAALIATFQLAVLAALVWGVCRVDTWWADAAWVVLMVCGATFFSVQRVSWGWQRLLLPAGAAVSVALALSGVCLLWALSSGSPLFTHHLLVPVAGLLAGQLTVSLGQGIQTYVSSLRNTKAHQRYLQANGATRLETIIPSVRRALRASALPSLRAMAKPVLMSLPLVFCGMLLCGASPVAAVLAVWLLHAAVLLAAIVAQMVFFWLYEKMGAEG